MKPRRRKLLIALAVYVVSSAAATAIADRLAEPQLLLDSRQALWRLRPGFVGASATGGHKMATVDRDGYRVIPKTGRLGAMRVLTLGDSFTFGWDVADEETYPAQLQYLLDRRAPGRFEVINGGFPGCSSFQASELFESRIDSLKPALVVTLLGRNDGRLAQLSDARSHSYLRWKPDLSRYLFPLGFVHYRMVQSIAKKRGLTPVPRVSKEEFQRNMRRLVQIADRRDVDLILMEAWTGQNELSPKAIAEEHELGYLATPKIVNAASKRIGQPLFIESHHHPNAVGYGVIAEALAEVVLKRTGQAAPIRTTDPGE